MQLFDEFHIAYSWFILLTQLCSADISCFVVTSLKVFDETDRARDRVCPFTAAAPSDALVLLLQASSGGFREDERFLRDRGRVFLTQKLHFHLLTHPNQVDGQVSEGQALLRGVAVRS